MKRRTTIGRTKGLVNHASKGHTKGNTVGDEEHQSAFNGVVIG